MMILSFRASATVVCSSHSGANSFLKFYKKSIKASILLLLCFKSLPNDKFSNSDNAYNVGDEFMQNYTV